MKISKLFHWLYACLMLLPILLFIPSALYYGFNEHADNGTQTATADIEYQYKYETNEVNSTSDLIEGNLYNFEDFELYASGDGAFVMNIVHYDLLVNMSSSYSYEDLILDDYYDSKDSVITIYVNSDDGNIYFTDNRAYVNVLFEDFDVEITNCDFYISGNTLNGFKDWIDAEGILPSASTYNVIESATATIEYNNDKSIVNAMSSAWDDVWQLPLFSWSGNSFLTAPFNYITALFSMPNNSTFVYALSYWLAISLVYLVFDIIMYVPLLVHRLIDKARIE